ncbi:hypothetical protein D4R71_01670 [bacterium]|nr:MAG: hypothetical protein D4R71_01670 [bacterium]
MNRLKVSIFLLTTNFLTCEIHRIFNRVSLWLTKHKNNNRFNGFSVNQSGFCRVDSSFTNDFWYDMICKFKIRMVNYLPKNANFKDRYSGILCIMRCYRNN